MASLPYRTAMGTGGLAGIFGAPGQSLFNGAPAMRQAGVSNRQPVGYGFGGHPFYNLVAYHQSRAYRDRSGRLGGGGPFVPQPPYNGGQPPRRLPPPVPRPPVFPVGPQPIGPEAPQTAIYYNPNGASAPVEHPALALARLLNG